MAELLECLICGYQTTRCGMSNHLAAKHPAEYQKYQKDFYENTGTMAKEVPYTLTKYIGLVKHWSKNRTQKPL